MLLRDGVGIETEQAIHYSITTRRAGARKTPSYWCPSRPKVGGPANPFSLAGLQRKY